MTDDPQMQRASDFDPEVLLIFDQYVHGDIDRRTFLARVGKFAVGTVTAAGLLGALFPLGGYPGDEDRARTLFQTLDQPKAFEDFIAANDERVNASWPPYEAALKAAGVKHAVHVYPNTQHGFHNDTTPRYDADAAQLAWRRTVEMFNRVLRP